MAFHGAAVFDLLWARHQVQTSLKGEKLHKGVHTKVGITGGHVRSCLPQTSISQRCMEVQNEAMSMKDMICLLFTLPRSFCFLGCTSSTSFPSSCFGLNATTSKGPSPNIRVWSLSHPFNPAPYVSFPARIAIHHYFICLWLVSSSMRTRSQPVLFSPLSPVPHTW